MLKCVAYKNVLDFLQYYLLDLVPAFHPNPNYIPPKVALLT